MKKGQSSAAAGNPTLRSITPLFADHSQLLLGGLMVDEEDKIFQLSSCNNVNMLHFSPDPDASSKCNSDVHVTGGVAKKPRTTQQSSAAHSTFKARREKLGDRITALHQLVSPFGKTDTASVLLEAIGYIKFLESQIESLTQPYLSSGSRSRSQQHPDCHEEPKNLRSRGLCLVPISCTLHVGNDNIGADYWAPAFGANIG